MTRCSKISSLDFLWAIDIIDSVVRRLQNGVKKVLLGAHQGTF